MRVRALQTLLALSLSTVGCGHPPPHLGGIRGMSTCGATERWSEAPASLRDELFPATRDTASAREAAEMRARWYPALQASDRIELELSPAACRQALLALRRREPLATEALSAEAGINVVILRVGPYWKVDLWADPPPELVLSGGGTTWVISRATGHVVAGPIVGL